jgi:hypothetical protein
VEHGPGPRPESRVHRTVAPAEKDALAYASGSLMARPWHPGPLQLRWNRSRSHPYVPHREKSISTNGISFSKLCFVQAKLLSCRPTLWKSCIAQEEVASMESCQAKTASQFRQRTGQKRLSKSIVHGAKSSPAVGFSYTLFCTAGQFDDTRWRRHPGPPTPRIPSVLYTLPTQSQHRWHDGSFG